MDRSVPLIERCRFQSVLCSHSHIQCWAEHFGASHFLTQCVLRSFLSFTTKAHSRRSHFCSLGGQKHRTSLSTSAVTTSVELARLRSTKLTSFLPSLPSLNSQLLALTGPGITDTSHRQPLHPTTAHIGSLHLILYNSPKPLPFLCHLVLSSLCCSTLPNNQGHSSRTSMSSTLCSLAICWLLGTSLHSGWQRGSDTDPEILLTWLLKYQSSRISFSYRTNSWIPTSLVSNVVSLLRLPEQTTVEFLRSSG